MELNDFMPVPKDADLCFSVVNIKGERRYYRVAASDLSLLQEAAQPELCRAPKILRVFEYFIEKDLRCQEPLIDECIHPELDPQRKPKKDMPDTANAITKVSHEGEERFKRDIGETL